MKVYMIYRHAESYFGVIIWGDIAMHRCRIKEKNNDIEFFYSINYNACKFIASHQQKGKKLSIRSKV